MTDRTHTPTPFLLPLPASTRPAITQAEDPFRALVEASPTPLLLSSLEEGRVLYANDHLERLLGVPHGSLIGQMTTDYYFDPSDRTTLLEAVQRQGSARDLELLLKRADGSLRWASLSVQTLEFKGSPALATALIDVTEHKQAEAALRASEESYRSLFDNLTDLVYIQDLTGHFLNVNQAVLTAYGYRREEIIGQTPDFLAAPGKVDIEDTMARFQRAVAGVPQRFDWWGRRKDGSIFPKEIKLTRSRYFGEDVVIGVARDMSDRFETEEALRVQKTLLQAQGEASIDGILLVSDDGTILSHNQRFAELWRLPPEVLATGSDRAAVEAVLKQVQDPKAFQDRVAYLYAHREETARDEISLRDGRVFDRYSAPVVGSTGEYYGRIWFFRDMTTQKRYAEALEQARREADRAREHANHYARSLERELEFGHKIQKSFLPVALPQPHGWEIAARFHPARQVAGDFYDAFELSNGRIGLLIGDVSGKGVGAALFMALFHSLIRSSVERAAASVMPDLLPDDNALLSEAIIATNGYLTRVHKPAHIFASVFLGLLDTETGILRYVNAGHEPPVLLGSDGTMQPLRPTGPALGILAGAPFEVGQVLLAPGMLLLIFTDGVTETRSADGRFFERERLEALLTEPAPTATRQLDYIVAAVRHFSEKAPPHDDLTLLAVLRRSG